MRMTRYRGLFERRRIGKDLLLDVVTVAVDMIAIFLACGLRVGSFLADQRFVGGGCTGRRGCKGLCVYTPLGKRMADCDWGGHIHRQSRVLVV